MPQEDDENNKDEEKELQERRVVDAEIRAAEQVIDKMRHDHTAKQLAKNPYFMDAMSRLERNEEAREVSELLGNFENILPEIKLFIEQFVQEILEEGTDFETLHKDHLSALRHILLLYRDMKRIKTNETTENTPKNYL